MKFLVDNLIYDSFLMNILSVLHGTFKISLALKWDLIITIIFKYFRELLHVKLRKITDV